MKRLLLIGAAGFIGHHLLKHVLRATDWKISADRPMPLVESAPRRHRWRDLQLSALTALERDGSKRPQLEVVVTKLH